MNTFKLERREDRPATIEEHAALRAEIERLRAWATDEQQKREAVEEGRLRERQDNDRLRDALQRSHKELLQYAWYDQGLTGLRERNENALNARRS